MIKQSNISLLDADANSITAKKATPLILFIAILLTAATQRSPITGVGSLIVDIQHSTGLSHTLAGMLTTLPLIAFAVFALAAPKLSIRFGMELTLLSCMIALTVGIIVRSLSTVTELFIGTALIGSAIAVCNVLVPSMIKRDYSHRIGLMTALYTSSMNLMSAIASGISVPLSRTAIGWRGSLACWVILSVITALCWLPLLGRNKEHKSYVKQQSTSADHSIVKIASKPKSLWVSPVAWQVTVFMGLQSIMFYVGISWLPEILHERGMSIDKAGWMLSLMQILGMVGSFVMPLIAARTQSQKLLTAASASLFLFGFGGIWLGSTTLAPLFITLIGLGCGTTFSLVILFFAFRTRTAEEAAKLSGMAQSVGYLVAAVGPTLFGFIHDKSGNWNAPLATITCLTILTIIIGYLAGRKGYVNG
ncbi:putative transporter YycB [compost metagenome]